MVWFGLYQTPSTPLSLLRQQDTRGRKAYRPLLSPNSSDELFLAHYNSIARNGTDYTRLSPRNYICPHSHF